MEFRVVGLLSTNILQHLQYRTSVSEIWKVACSRGRKLERGAAAAHDLFEESGAIKLLLVHLVVFIAPFLFTDNPSKMEVVNEHDEADDGHQGIAIVEDENSRVQQKPTRGSPPRGLSRKPSVQRSESGSLNAMRGASRPGAIPIRSQSMRAVVRPLAPTKSTDHLASMRASRAQRGNISRVAPVRSQSSVLGAPRRVPPDRTSSVDSTNSLRAFRRDQMGGVESGTMERLL